VHATSMDRLPHLNSVYVGLVEATESPVCHEPGPVPARRVQQHGTRASQAGNSRGKAEAVFVRLRGRGRGQGRAVFGSVLAAVSGRDAPARGRGRGWPSVSPEAAR
jgi:hypothetical protein